MDPHNNFQMLQPSPETMMRQLSIDVDEFSKAPTSRLVDNRAYPSFNQGYGQVPLVYPNSGVSGSWPSFGPNMASADMMEFRRLQDIIDQSTDQQQAIFSKTDPERHGEATQEPFRFAATDPGAGYLNNAAPYYSVPHNLGRRSIPQLNAAAGPFHRAKQHSPANIPRVDAARPAPRQHKPKHKRTETPEQLHLRQFTQDRIYTLGIDPQSTRGLLHDYFEDIRKWASFYVKDLSAREVEEYSKMPEVCDMLRGMSDVQHMLTDSETRKDIIASIMIRHIVFHALGDLGLVHSKHPSGEQCRELCFEYGQLEENAYALKYQVDLKQKELYTKLKNHNNHKRWRTNAAEESTDDLLTTLSCVLKPGAHPERDHVLTELYIKGYRIGFRLRMSAVKWRIVWPVAGTDVNMKRMVNQTRYLFGDPATTFMKMSENPQNFFVRFALTPTFMHIDHSSGDEVKELVHSAMVHVGVRGVFSHLRGQH